MAPRASTIAILALSACFSTFGVRDDDGNEARISEQIDESPNSSTAASERPAQKRKSVRVALPASPDPDVVAWARRKTYSQILGVQLLASPANQAVHESLFPNCPSWATLKGSLQQSALDGTADFDECEPATGTSATEMEKMKAWQQFRAVVKDWALKQAEQAQLPEFDAFKVTCIGNKKLGADMDCNVVAPQPGQFIRSVLDRMEGRIQEVCPDSDFVKGFSGSPMTRVERALDLNFYADLAAVPEALFDQFIAREQWHRDMRPFFVEAECSKGTQWRILKVVYHPAMEHEVATNKRRVIDKIKERLANASRTHTAQALGPSAAVSHFGAGRSPISTWGGAGPQMLMIMDQGAWAGRDAASWENAVNGFYHNMAQGPASFSADASTGEFDWGVFHKRLMEITQLQTDSYITYAAIFWVVLKGQAQITPKAGQVLDGEEEAKRVSDGEQHIKLLERILDGCPTGCTGEPQMLKKTLMKMGKYFARLLTAPSSAALKWLNDNGRSVYDSIAVPATIDETTIATYCRHAVTALKELFPALREVTAGMEAGLREYAGGPADSSGGLSAP